MTNMISWIKGIPEAEMYNHVSYKIMLCILHKPRGLCATAETGFQSLKFKLILPSRDVIGRHSLSRFLIG